MNCTPHWTAFLSALLTPVVAFLGIGIAYRQWKLGEDKLRYDLFDRRFELYITARNFLASVVTTGKTTTADILNFSIAVREAKWLLDDDAACYLSHTLRDKADELVRLKEDLPNITEFTSRQKNTEQWLIVKAWFGEQYVVLDKKFTPFLRLTGDA